MINKLIKTFDETNNFNNVIIPLSLEVKEIVYIYHHSIDENNKNIVLKIINKYKDIKVSFIKVDEESIKEIVDENSVVDVSVSKYISLVLTELAFKDNLNIIYFDIEERKIKEYKTHKVLCEKLFKFNIEDIITLGNGRIIDHLHRPTTNNETKELIYNVIKVDRNYSKFISYMNSVNQLISNFNNEDNTYYLNESVINKITSSSYYTKYFSTLNLFKIEGNKLIFFNDDIKRIFTASGSLLEDYIYNKLIDSNLFDDVSMSVKIEFNTKEYKYPVTCELDGLVLKDNTLLFVSVKSNKVDASALNEIKVHNIRFGNNYSKSVICVNSDLNVDSPSIYSKAMELGIYVIDDPYFKQDKIADKFLSIINNTYVYDKI